MPGSATSRDRRCARVDAHPRVAFHRDKSVGVPIDNFAAQWLAYAFPCRRFAFGLATESARLGASADRYSFTAVDLHHLLLAGLPAHCHRNAGNTILILFLETRMLPGELEMRSSTRSKTNPAPGLDYTVVRVSHHNIGTCSLQGFRSAHTLSPWRWARLRSQPSPHFFEGQNATGGWHFDAASFV